MSNFKIEPTTDPSTGIIRVEGQLIVGNRQALKALVWDVDQNIIVDLTGTGYVDASGLGVLITIARHLREKHRRLVLCGLNDDLLTLLELTRVDSLILTVYDEKAALDAIAVGDDPVIFDAPDEEEPRTKPRKAYNDTDLLEFEEAREWWGCAARTLERMNLPWSFPTRARGGGRLRRIMFRDLVAHYERRKVG